MRCTDPLGTHTVTYDGKKVIRGYRFEDNGHYIGHDEPSVKFISNAAGSGNTMTYFMKLPVDPKKAPTPNGSVTDYNELSIAPWFGLPMCDPDSYPQNPCTPDSDTNSGSISNPNDAGSAFMELQFYPPGMPRSRTPSAAPDPVVRGDDHRQPRVPVQFRGPQPGLRGASQLRLPAAQRRASRAAEPAAGRSGDRAPRTVRRC